MTRAADRDVLRRDLLAATLAQVPFEGWSARALAAGARDAGVAMGAARRAFPRGIADLVAFWGEQGDRRMLEMLADIDLDSMRVRERIATLVRLRLEVDAEHREALRLALGRAMLPGEAPHALGALWRRVDAMWRAAGDTATDYNYYTKRGLLAGVYASTLLYWLDDKSRGSAATWAFLDRRVAEVLKVPRALGKLKNCLPDTDVLLRAGGSRTVRGRSRKFGPAPFQRSASDG
ncbi:MAG: COQ9 family protein [Alphaproteobacteria bacterium]